MFQRLKCLLSIEYLSIEDSRIVDKVEIDVYEQDEDISYLTSKKFFKCKKVHKQNCVQIPRLDSLQNGNSDSQ